MKFSNKKQGVLVKKATKKSGASARASLRDTLIQVSVENSKRRRMFSLMCGDLHFFDRILSVKRLEDSAFFSGTSFRNR